MRNTLKLFLLLFLLASCGSMFFKPWQNTNPDAPVNYSEISFKSSDGTRLNAWLFKANMTFAKGTIVFFHGNSRNVSYNTANVQWITNAGYNYFIFDYRGYGKSEGKPDQRGLFMDGTSACEKALEIHRKTVGEKKPFIIYAASMGGAIALRSLLDFKEIDEVSFLVLDSTFLSFRDLAFDFAKKNWMTFVFSPAAYVLVPESRKIENLDYLKNVPTLVLHDKRDPVVSYKFGEEIFRKLVGKKYFWDMNDESHMRILKSKENQVAFISLIQQSLKQ